METKTITKQIQEVADEFCDNYCKWPDIYDEEAEGCELSESELLARNKEAGILLRGDI